MAAVRGCAVDGVPAEEPRRCDRFDRPPPAGSAEVLWKAGTVQGFPGRACS